MIALEDCKKGYAYKVLARNFLVAIFDGDDGFIGIRKKFEDTYLAVEYHKEIGGTVKPTKELEEFGQHVKLNQYSDELFAFLYPMERAAQEQSEKEIAEYIKKAEKNKGKGARNETAHQRNS